MNDDTPHGRCRVGGIEEDGPGVEVDGRFAVAHVPGHGQLVAMAVARPLLVDPPPRAVPGDAGAAPEFAREEDDVQVAKGLDDEIRFPVRNQQAGAQAVDGRLHRGRDPRQWFEEPFEVAAGLFRRLDWARVDAAAADEGETPFQTGVVARVWRPFVCRYLLV